ncbi:hypothetical protein JO972_10260 [Verrucomicrobiaceae bacterium 5K15]|uniref:Uncharacterized protein n=1 Tax=Oceaniferula flava TaxID=2800421 RepID=A0AAE2V8C2_9BACT|nr:hypothetical protein [Oceaniferula flavus]MBK1855342.1 hypothetical protein [Oceaniferula flavus]MBM1136648.1 hypothetical protein [Oceaniferula flavus]
MNMHRVGRQIYRWEGGLFNVLCAIYFIVLGPRVVEAADYALRTPGSKVHWLGFLLIGIGVAEIYAWPIKMRYVREAVRAFGDSIGAGFVLWMFHAVISIILLFLGASAFGVPVADSSNADMPGWLALLMLAVVIKELVFLGFLMWDGKESSDAPVSRYIRPNRREWLIDFILVSYACVAYSATWGAITMNMTLEKENPVMFVVNVCVSALLFLIFYLPLRIPYWLEEVAQTKTHSDRFKLLVSIFSVLIPALVSLS